MRNKITFLLVLAFATGLAGTFGQTLTGVTWQGVILPTRTGDFSPLEVRIVFASDSATCTFSRFEPGDSGSPGAWRDYASSSVVLDDDKKMSSIAFIGGGQISEFSLIVLPDSSVDITYTLHYLPNGQQTAEYRVGRGILNAKN